MRGIGATAGHDCGTRGRRRLAAAPVGGRAWPDNDPTRRSKLAARTAEAGGTDTTARYISHAIPPRYESTQSQKPQNINDQNPTPTCAHGNCMRNCWLAAIAGLRGDVPSNISREGPSGAKAPPAWRAPEGPQAWTRRRREWKAGLRPENLRVRKQQPAPRSDA